MNIFQSDIIRIYGEKGKAWLNELPELVMGIASSLDLRDLKPVTNLCYNYVLSGFQGDNPIILKLGLDDVGLKREAFALKCFAGYGAVTVLSEDDGMFLMERAMPGASLKSYFQNKEKESIEIACRVIKKLHKANIPVVHNFSHVKDWLTDLDKDWNIPNHYLQKARKLRGKLLQTSKTDVLLHGDLHHDNILENGNDWVVIDPKGVIGEPAYEVAAFIRNPIPELLIHKNAHNIIHNRIACFVKILELSAHRVADWCFVQAVLSWVWAIQDGCDDDYYKKLTEFFDRYADL